MLAHAEPEVTIEPIPNFRAITAADGKVSVYRGANPIELNQEEGIAKLSFLGIAVDIDLQGGDLSHDLAGLWDSFSEKGEQPAMIAKEKEMSEKNGFRFVNLPLNSHAPITAKEDELIHAALELMKAATPEHPVYIHCEHGVDRTGLLAALYRVKVQGWTPEDAKKEWDAYGHNFVSRIFTGYLDDYFNEQVK